MATLVVYKSLRNLVLFVPTWVVVQAFANLHRWAFGIRKHSVIEMLACAFLVVKDYLDSLSASTQSEIVLFMHGLHPGKGMLRDQQLKRKGHSMDNEECTCKHLDHPRAPHAATLNPKPFSICFCKNN